MDYNLVKQVIDLVKEFKTESSEKQLSVENFKRWIAIGYNIQNLHSEPNWIGKENGRSADSVINTLIVHLNRYAKSYSKSAIFGSDFSSQDDFIYLITLKAFGEMTKMELVKKNVHEKPVGMQVINRLIAKEWVSQITSGIDKRSKILKITDKGLQVLDRQMDKIRNATQIVTGDLTHNEKMQLIHLLSKLDDFHKPIYEKNIEPENLLEEVLGDSGMGSLEEVYHTEKREFN